MITAENITDAQIRDLRTALKQEEPPFGAWSDDQLAAALLDCERALYGGSEALSRCAEIINARGAK